MDIKGQVVMWYTLAELVGFTTAVLVYTSWEAISISLRLAVSQTITLFRESTKKSIFHPSSCNSWCSKPCYLDFIIQIFSFKGYGYSEHINNSTYLPTGTGILCKSIYNCSLTARLIWKKRDSFIGSDFEWPNILAKVDERRWPSHCIIVGRLGQSTEEIIKYSKILKDRSKPGFTLSCA